MIFTGVSVGEALFVSLVSGCVLHRHQFGRPTPCVRYSADGRFIVALRDGDAHIYAAPGVHCHQYNPFALRKIYHLSPEEVYCACWSGDSR